MTMPGYPMGGSKTEETMFTLVRTLGVPEAALAEQIKAAAGLSYVPAQPTAAAARTAAAAVKPGKERWKVKTGQDPGASQVGLKPGTTQHVIVDTTVEELVKIKRPNG